MPHPFRRGDATRDGTRDITDILAILRKLFLGHHVPCDDAVDVDDSSSMEITDALALAYHIFFGWEIPGPHTEGHDDTEDELLCE